MHRDLKALLPHARGESHFVIAVFLDVRGFSSFAKFAESVEAAVFLRSVYLRILEEYYPEPSFFKPTGDGLMVILDYDENTLSGKLADVVEKSVAVVNNFAAITAEDQMINFEVPTLLGIGISRGAATALVSDGKTLDYSGRPLNMAARLMDLARPSGVVFSANVGPELLPAEILDEFVSESVYIKGIAEIEPTEILYLKDRTVISPINKRPLTAKPSKVLEAENMTFKSFVDRGPIFLHRLPSMPSDVDGIKVHVSSPKPKSNGTANPSVRRATVIAADFRERAGKFYAKVDYAVLAEELRKQGVKSTWKIRVQVEYPE